MGIWHKRAEMGWKFITISTQEKHRVWRIWAGGYSPFSSGPATLWSFSVLKWCHNASTNQTYRIEKRNEEISEMSSSERQNTE